MDTLLHSSMRRCTKQYSDRVAKCKDPVFDNRCKDNKTYTYVCSTL